MSDDVIRIGLMVGVMSLIHFQMWMVRYWRQLDPSRSTAGLWMISAHNCLGVILSSYAFFDLSLVRVG